MKSIKKWLGEEFFETLEKSTLYKPHTKTALDTQELFNSMQIVPKAIISWLSLQLRDMKINGILDIEIPFAEGTLHLVKLESDVYNGQITHAGKVLTAFRFKSLPGVGLVITSTFELYDNSKITEEKPELTPQESEKSKEISKLIDERIHLLELVNKVVDQKISQKEAINDVVLKRINLLDKDASKNDKPIKKIVTKVYFDE